MTEKQLRDRIDEINNYLQNPVIQADAAAVQTLEDEKKNVQDELDKLMASSGNFANAMLNTIANLMSSGSGVDSPQVRAIIEDYLKNDKVKLNELDQSVLDEIKKNQTVYLEIPNFGKKIEITKDQLDLPNFYSILDDVLAGNNVFLIGEAGGGKTFTAKQIAKVLNRESVTINCSQYTSPLEILGGQSIEGFKEGKLIDAWKNGKILILDEMPKLDPNTAGLLNDALAQSTKTTRKEDATINSANPEQPPIERNNDFGVIATGNIYPNERPAPQYLGNSQQDLSLLDRFSGSVYYTEFDPKTDEKTTRFKFLYKFLIGNYYEFIEAKRLGKTAPAPIGLRTVIDLLNFKNMALVSYRTNIAFRVAFEFELVRKIMKDKGIDVTVGKTFLGTFKSYMVAFGINTQASSTILKETAYTDDYINTIVEDAIEQILSGQQGFMDALNPYVASHAAPIFKSYQDFYVAETAQLKP